ncbi:hypothetical protein MARPO_0105s0020 [Marchantia polymorpha]|uniref:Uncharacterized protein n=1 Tax=Marchantia polymorpha TaxID=3197 RepID=A0A2R6WDH0_MARPO|nr:hypothetical protein MARPO_0105s0020 [Marchantia polymorpha]|eukprot:PTQ31901.1 hypothetical protein MARPO_0105s0020 [Marchantia polymorpha]
MMTLEGLQERGGGGTSGAARDRCEKEWIADKACARGAALWNNMISQGGRRISRGIKLLSSPAFCVLRIEKTLPIRGCRWTWPWAAASAAAHVYRSHRSICLRASAAHCPQTSAKSLLPLKYTQLPLPSSLPAPLAMSALVCPNSPSFPRVPEFRRPSPPALCLLLPAAAALLSRPRCPGHAHPSGISMPLPQPSRTHLVIQPPTVPQLLHSALACFRASQGKARQGKAEEIQRTESGFGWAGMQDPGGAILRSCARPACSVLLYSVLSRLTGKCCR